MKKGDAFRAQRLREMRLRLEQLRGKNPKPGTATHATMVSLEARIKMLGAQP